MKNWTDKCAKELQLIEKYNGQDLVVFDTETTGLSPERDRIIQFAGIRFEIKDEQLIPKCKYSTYINPERKLPQEIINLTGIDQETVDAAPKESEIITKLSDFFKGVSVVCGHNVDFDISFMNNTFLRNKIKFVFQGKIDTCAMARSLIGKDEVLNYKQPTLLAYLSLNKNLNAHNAFDDVVGCWRLLSRLLDMAKDVKDTGSADKIKVKVAACWPYSFPRKTDKVKEDGRPVYVYDFRLYVKTDYEDRIVWFHQCQPYEWGEKTRGTLEKIDMADLQEKVLAMYKCKTVAELARVSKEKR